MSRSSAKPPVRPSIPGENLINNADPAMPRGGTITIRAENVIIGEKDPLPLKRGKYLRISVSDEGIGISGKDMPNIFDPFFTTKQRGSGLGLTTVFSVVNNHGGHVNVISEVEAGTPNWGESCPR